MVNGLMTMPSQVPATSPLLDKIEQRCDHLIDELQWLLQVQLAQLRLEVKEITTREDSQACFVLQN